MVPHRPPADVQPTGDLRVAQPEPEQGQHLPLTGSQSLLLARTPTCGDAEHPQQRGRPIRAGLGSELAVAGQGGSRVADRPGSGDQPAVAGPAAGGSPRARDSSRGRPAAVRRPAARPQPLSGRLARRPAGPLPSRRAPPRTGAGSQPPARGARRPDLPPRRAVHSRTCASTVSASTSARALGSTTSAGSVELQHGIGHVERQGESGTGERGTG